MKVEMMITNKITYDLGTKIKVLNYCDKYNINKPCPKMKDQW